MNLYSETRYSLIMFWYCCPHAPKISLTHSVCFGPSTSLMEELQPQWLFELLIFLVNHTLSNTLYPSQWIRIA